MPKKKNPEIQKEQSERFKKTVADLVAAGELIPTEADAALEALVTRSVAQPAAPLAPQPPRTTE